MESIVCSLRTYNHSGVIRGRLILIYESPSRPPETVAADLDDTGALLCCKQQAATCSRLRYLCLVRTTTGEGICSETFLERMRGNRSYANKIVGLFAFPCVYTTPCLVCRFAIAFSHTATEMHTRVRKRVNTRLHGTKIYYAHTRDY